MINNPAASHGEANQHTVITLTALNETNILLTWPEIILPVQHQQIIRLQQSINANLNLPIIDSVVSYNSLLIHFNFLKMNAQTFIHLLKKEVKALLDSTDTQTTSTPKEIVIPVYYGEDAGWDLAHIAKTKELTINEAINKHTAKAYCAYALGFTPGFCYLAEVDEALTMPRRKTPRTIIPKGAVAIAEQQTAVYPNQSPGGWHILGQTPLAMYELTENDFKPRINVGDNVKFEAIDKTTFDALGGKCMSKPIGDRHD